jgi:hypothetical protein
MRLNKHPSPIPDVLPPLDYLTKYALNDPGGSAHVFWRDSRANHGHDRDGQATLKWRVKPTIKTRCISRGVYNVVRLIMEHREIPIENVENVCGLPQCVNVLHWCSRPRLAPYRLALVQGAWQVVVARTGFEVATVTAVRLQALDGGVHTARAAPQEPIALLCGAPIDPATSVIVESLVTCKGGC